MLPEEVIIIVILSSGCFEGLGSYASLVAGIVPMCFLLLLLTAGLAQDGLYSSLQSLLLCEGLI